MNSNETIVLMYHDVYQYSPDESGVIENGASMYKIKIDLFEEHIKTIAEYIRKNNLSNESILLTFDDGGVSFYRIIAPVLERYGLRGIFFIATKFIDTSGFLSRSQVIELQKRGHKIATHSYSHPTNIAALNYSDIIYEWEKSCKELEEILGEKMEIASIPNSITSRKVYKAAAFSGIKMLFTSIPTTKMRNLNGMIISGRFVIYSETSTDDLIQILNSSNKRMKMKFRYNVLGIIHALLGNQYDRVKNFFIMHYKRQD